MFARVTLGRDARRRVEEWLAHKGILPRGEDEDEAAAAAAAAAAAQGLLARLKPYAGSLRLDAALGAPEEASSNGDGGGGAGGSVFDRATIDSVAVVRPLKVLPATADIAQALQILSRNEILSAPVCNGEHLIVGLLDYFSIGQLLVDLVARMEPASDSGSPGDEERLAGGLASAAALPSCLSALSASSTFSILGKGAPMRQMLRAMAAGQHRVLAVEADPVAASAWRAVDLLAQSDVIKMFAMDTSVLGAWGAQPVRTMLPRFAGTSIVSVPASASFFHALEQMHAHRVHAVGVVDDADFAHFRGCVGATALKEAAARGWSVLAAPVSELLSSTPALFVDAGTPIAEMIQEVSRVRAHRVWVTGDAVPAAAHTDADEPAQLRRDGAAVLAVVSLTDIIHAVLECG